MKWIKDDVEKYVTAKEYIDTVILPLIPFDMAQELEKSAYHNESLTLLTKGLEKERTGRVMLAPTYYYIKSNDLSQELIRVNSWIENFQEQPFKHVFLITFDATWKKNEQALKGSLIWLPSIPQGNLYTQEMQQMIMDQVNQIGELIHSYWQ